MDDPSLSWPPIEDQFQSRLPYCFNCLISVTLKFMKVFHENFFRKEIIGSLVFSLVVENILGSISGLSICKRRLIQNCMAR